MADKSAKLQKLKDGGLFPKGVRPNATHRAICDSLSDSDVKALIRANKKAEEAGGKRPVALGIFPK
jgi:hypothetical protein